MQVVIGNSVLPPLISVEEACKLLGIGRSGGYRAAAAGELPTLRLGRRLYVPTAKLLEMLGLEGRYEDYKISVGDRLRLGASCRFRQGGDWRDEWAGACPVPVLRKDSWAGPSKKRHVRLRDR
jgi:excisionase family DNA binding protein